MGIGCSSSDGDNNSTPYGTDVTIVTSDDINALSGQTTISGNLSIVSSDLTDLVGLESLTSIQGNLLIRYTSSLESLNGLDNVTSIGGDLYVAENDDLSTLNGLDNLNSVGRHIYIFKNKTLKSIAALINIKSVNNDLQIIDNALESLQGLNNITKVGYLLCIGGNQLTNLDGLSSLTSAGSLAIGWEGHYNNNEYDLQIWNTTPSVEDIEALSNLCFGKLYTNSGRQRT